MTIPRSLYKRLQPGVILYSIIDTNKIKDTGQSSTVLIIKGFDPHCKC